MGLFDRFGKNKDKVKDSAVQEVQAVESIDKSFDTSVIDANRQSACRIVKDIRMVSAKLETAFAEISPEEKAKRIEKLRNVGDELDASNVNMDPNAVKIDQEIENCIGIIKKSMDVEHGSLEPVDASIEGITNAIKERAKYSEEELKRVQLYVSKAKFSLEIIVIENVIKYQENVKANALANIEKITAQIKSEEDEDVKESLYASRKELRDFAKSVDTEIQVRSNALQKFKMQRDIIDMTAKNRTTLSDGELNDIGNSLDEARLRELEHVKNTHERLSEMMDSNKAIDSIYEDINIGIRAGALADVQGEIERDKAEAKNKSANEQKAEAAETEAEDGGLILN